MAFNFFQKKNRSDSGRTSKVKLSEKLSAVLESKKSDVSLVSKKENLEPSKKTVEAPKNMIPHISEKSSTLQGQNSYVFKVEKNVNKIMLKKAVENHYGVKVNMVRVLNTKPKKRIRGNIVGKKPGYKKAIVQLIEGQKIEF